MSNIPFNIRCGLDMNSNIKYDFPNETRVGLLHVLTRFIDEKLIGGWHSLLQEVCRCARTEMPIIEEGEQCLDYFKEILYEVDWIRVYVLCERIYELYLTEVLEYDSNYNVVDCVVSKEEAKKLFVKEINVLLLEDNIGFEFKNGVFFRRGRAITQKLTNRVGNVLIDKKLSKVKNQYVKAQQFFIDKENPDYANTVKESLCALELTAEILTGEKISKDFSANMKKYQGNSYNLIPAPIIQSMIKIFGYRGSGEGVVHGINKGLRVSRYEAELVLNTTASFITYLYDFFNSINETEELPF